MLSAVGNERPLSTVYSVSAVKPSVQLPPLSSKVTVYCTVVHSAVKTIFATIPGAISVTFSFLLFNHPVKV